MSDCCTSAYCLSWLHSRPNNIDWPSEEKVRRVLHRQHLVVSPESLGGKAAVYGWGRYSASLYINLLWCGGFLSAARKGWQTKWALNRWLWLTKTCAVLLAWVQSLGIPPDPEGRCQVDLKDFQAGGEEWSSGSPQVTSLLGKLLDLTVLGEGPPASWQLNGTMGSSTRHDAPGVSSALLPFPQKPTELCCYWWAARGGSGTGTCWAGSGSCTPGFVVRR